MTEQEKQIKEIHGMMTVVVRMSENHEKTLYGNGQPGLKDRMTIQEQGMARFKGIMKRLSCVETKQSNCVAAKGHVRSNMIFAITIVMCGVSILSFIGTMISKFFWHI